MPDTRRMSSPIDPLERLSTVERHSQSLLFTNTHTNNHVRTSCVIISVLSSLYELSDKSALAKHALTSNNQSIICYGTPICSGVAWIRCEAA